MRQWRIAIARAFPISFLALAFVVGGALAYDSYDGGSAPGCADCHPGFNGLGAPLHDLHVGSSQMTLQCSLCHTSIADNPRTWTSGIPGGQGCRGCHGAPGGADFFWGRGLRAHHAAAGAPPDAFGLFCVTCHSNDPPADGEDQVPFYYGQVDVQMLNPCATVTPTGEDWNGDGRGLDNDGDLAYDQNDTDCIVVPVRVSTWGVIKSLYR